MGKLFIAAAACGAALGCGSASAPRPTQVHTFRLEVFADQVGVVYAYDDLVPKVERVRRAGAPVVSITERDVAQCELAPRFARTMTMILTDDASARVGAAVATLGETSPVVASIDDQVMWVGVTYNPMGAAAIETPIVSFPAQASSRVAIKIDAAIGVGIRLPESSDESTRIDSGALRSIFATCAAGAS